MLPGGMAVDTPSTFEGGGLTVVSDATMIGCERSGCPTMVVLSPPEKGATAEIMLAAAVAPVSTAETATKPKNNTSDSH